ncbi:hypothetical protein [Pelagibacterium montanilacus]|uniref:hypothetical protein n=1 Tax=Pelagibacterium montanilacus TaxID=2185280 RepID=UPI000F8DF684|nr:hypothetical protein [Pelagibacterium montanilacus]
MDSKHRTLRETIICDDFTTCARIALEDNFRPKREVVDAASERKDDFPHEAGETDSKPRIVGGKGDFAMHDQRNSTRGELGDQFDLAVAAKPPPSIEIDTAKYQKYLDDPTLSDEQREEIIQALWSIITVSVDLGFGVHPAQQVQDADSQQRSEFELEAQEEMDSNVLK